MDKDKYSVRVNWSDEDQVFIATVPEFPRLSAFGDTRQEAIREALLVLEGYIEIFEEDNLPLPEPEKNREYSGQLRVRMPKTLHKKLAETAEEEGVSLNHWINVLLADRYNIADTAKYAALNAAKTVLLSFSKALRNVIHDKKSTTVVSQQTGIAIVSLIGNSSTVNRQSEAYNN